MPHNSTLTCSCGQDSCEGTKLVWCQGMAVPSRSWLAVSASGTHEQWHGDVLFKRALLSQLTPVLTDTVALVGREEDVSFLQFTSLVETLYHLVNHFVDCLAVSKPIAIPFVIVNVGLILLGQSEKL